MKSTVTAIIAIACLLLFIGSSAVLAEAKAPASKKEKISYIIGTNMAKSLFQIKDEIEIDSLINGLQDQYAQKPLQISEEESAKIMREFSAKMTEKQKEMRKQASEKAVQEGKKFLADNTDIRDRIADMVKLKTGLTKVKEEAESSEQAAIEKA